MSETTSGPTASSAREERLDAFEAASGLPAGCPVEVQNEATRLLEATPAEVRAMTAAECGEAAYTLTQYAFYLQRLVNRETAKVTGEEEYIRRATGPHLCQQKAYAFEERRLLAMLENDAAKQADGRRVQARLRLDRVSYLSGKVEALARCLLSLQNTKSKREFYERS